MRAIWPVFECKIHYGALICKGAIQPSPVNGIYHVRVEYGRVGTPKVYVEDPPLRSRRPDELIPHTYPGPRPCLYLPGIGEWRPDRRIADTIIPWLSLWLAYYEIWHVTGQWLGGGVHHDGGGRIEQPSE
jgi:hypothetical protein